MRLRGVPALVALGLGTLSGPLASDAQPRAKIPQVGFLCWVTCGGPDHDAFWQALRKLGYVDYKNVIQENRVAGGDRALVDTLAADLVRLKVDIIVADSTPSALAAKKATGTIPIVTVTEDPLGSGLVATLARPGGNVTGVSSLAPELRAKQLELLKEAVPRAARVAVLWDQANPAKALGERAMQVAARGFGVTLLSFEVSQSPEYESAFAAMAGLRADALVQALSAWDNTGVAPTARLSQLAKKYRLPSIHHSSEFAAAGGLMSYGPDSAELFRRAAMYADKILRGAKAADLPVERPARYELTINRSTAEAFGLSIPQSLLVRADRVIE